MLVLSPPARRVVCSRNGAALTVLEAPQARGSVRGGWRYGSDLPNPWRNGFDICTVELRLVLNCFGAQNKTPT